MTSQKKIIFFILKYLSFQHQTTDMRLEITTLIGRSDPQNNSQFFLISYQSKPF